jgi:hypothetical protein
MGAADSEVERGIGDDYSDERALALKAIVQYLANTGTPLDEIAERDSRHNNPWEADKRFNAKIKLRGFMRQNSPVERYRSDWVFFRDAVKTSLESQDVSFPSFMSDVARAAGVHRQPSNDVPRFIDADGVLEALGGVEQMIPIMRRYQGCWRTYRQSPSQTEVLINAGFLNIKPLHLTPRSAPQFSFFQRSKDYLTGHPSALSKTFGVVAYTGECITLIGERSRRGVGLGYVSTMTWRDVDDGEIDSHVRSISGIATGASPEGSQVIAARFVASFIEGSRDLAPDGYEALKKEENAGTGPIPWHELKATLTDQDLIRSIEVSIAKSTGESIFQI